MPDRILTVLGAGYVGLTTAALLAHAGFTVYALEPNPERLAAIKRGRSFFFEVGLDRIIGEAIERGTLIPTDSYADSVPRSSVVFSAVGTPDNPDGSSNLTYVLSAAKAAAACMRPGTVYVQKSTVPVGTGQRIEALFEEAGSDVRYVSNPEFLREGTALYDTLYFDRIVAGGRDPHAVATVLDIYRELETQRDSIAQTAGIATADREGQYIATNLNSAELIKVTANAFLALKISFANSIAKLADQVGADVTEVMDAVGADTRIGRPFLNAGRGYGGGCFPKDVSGLIASGLEHGVDLEIMNAAQQVNLSMVGYIIKKLADALDTELAGRRIALLGLSFKAGTSDTRKSPGVAMANELSEAGADVIAYDPEAHEEAAGQLHAGVQRAASMEEALAGADAVVIATDWQEFIDYPSERYREAMAGRILVDAVNCRTPQDITAAGLQYIGVGRA